MPYLVCQNEECGDRFFERSELAVMSGCPRCGEDDVVLEESDWEPSPTGERPARERASDIRGEADRLLERYKVLEPPVDVERIASGEGLQIERRPIKGDGHIEGGVLTVNGTHSPTRQRFTIAHEIGHLILHADGTDENSEREANQFASALLMPRAMLREAVGGGEEFDLLRRRFQVSREAIWIALKEAQLERKVSGTPG